MIEVTLLDGSQLIFDSPVTGYEVANKISPSLAKQALAIYVNDALYDIQRKITLSCKVEIITSKNTGVALPLLRHDMAHVLAEAVVELFPNTKLATGPVTENGFFYDFLPEVPFKEEHLSQIEERMISIINRQEDICRYVLTKAEAVEKYKQQGERFKLEILENIQDETVSFYKQGNFEDMCRGPHSPNTAKIPLSFKLTKLSGVYWQGDSENPMLQRIYGVGFLSSKELEVFLNLQMELEKNDHRKLGREMDLFHIQEEAVGSIFWHDKGWKLYRVLENYIRDKLNTHFYQEVKTPQVISKSLWEASGHWDKFGENMFLIKSEEGEMALKPMNCPAHIQIFKQGQKSYRDLPYRMAEFGCCHRNEPSGALHGIMRVRAFTQDDAHIFCTEDQIASETIAFCKLLQEIYTEIFGNPIIIVKFSDRPQKRAGDDLTWDKAEQALLSAAKEAGLDPILNKGEGAFYGPKLEFAIKDSLGREWQLGTLQVDFILPERLGASYIGVDGNKHIPVMLHRAILGSFERFIGILLEHYKGKLPLWLSPIQIVIGTISNKFDMYGQKVHQLLLDYKISSLLDIRAEKINYKIREHTLNKTPIFAVIGEKEVENNEVTLRFLGKEQQRVVSIADLPNLLLHNITSKNMDI